MGYVITIADIAKAAKVSKTTVSRYLNGNYGGMSSRTRERIEGIVRETGYIPNNLARTLKSKKSGMIGVIVNTLRHQVGAQTVTGINEVCTRSGYSTIVHCTDGDEKAEEHAIRLCLKQQVEGIILIPCSNRMETYLEICSHGVPVVLCSRECPGWPYASVYVPHDRLIGSVLLFLQNQGYERVWMLQASDDHYMGWVAEVFRETAVRLLDMEGMEAVQWVGRETDSVGKVLDELMQKYPGQKKAVMASDTHTLFLVLHELMRKDIRFPEDFEVCGYDAVGWSELVYPGISVIKQPMGITGSKAAELLVRSLYEGSLPLEKIELDGQILFHGKAFEDTGNPGK